MEVTVPVISISLADYQIPYRCHHYGILLLTPTLKPGIQSLSLRPMLAYGPESEPRAVLLHRVTYTASVK